MKILVLLVALAMSGGAFAQGANNQPSGENGANAVPEVSPDQLKTFPFTQRQQEKPPVVSELSTGQKFLMDRQRQEVKDLIARHLGILALHQDKSDLDTIQQIYDRQLLKKTDMKDWQSVGVVFGDIIAKDFGMHWVSYEDERGLSRALQWKHTQNFIFPVTIFSKRIRFDEKIDAHKIYDKIKSDIEGFKAYEERMHGQ